MSAEADQSPSFISCPNDDEHVAEVNGFCAECGTRASPPTTRGVADELPPLWDLNDTLAS